MSPKVFIKTFFSQHVFLEISSITEGTTEKVYKHHTSFYNIKWDKSVKVAIFTITHC